MGLGQFDVLTLGQLCDVGVGAARVGTGVRGWSRACPVLQTLPAELVGLPSLGSTDGADHTQIAQVFSLNTCLAAGT